MQNYFHLFGINYNLLIEDAEVRQKFLQLIKAHHPDQFVNDSEQLELAMQKTIEINAAFNHLKHFEARVQHLLELCGKNSEEDKKPADIEFLMEMMDLNDRIEEIVPNNKTEWDSVNTELDSQLNAIMKGMQSQASMITDKLVTKEPEAFKTLPQIEQIQQEFQKLNYIKRLKNNLLLKSNS